MSCSSCCLAWSGVQDIEHPRECSLGSGMFIGRASAQHTLVTSLCLNTQGLTPADSARPHASSQENLETQLGQEVTAVCSEDEG